MRKAVVVMMFALALVQVGLSNGLGQGPSTGPTQGPGSAAQTSSPRKPRPPGTLPASERLDLNAATRTQLAALPGIGDKIAQRIIEGRPYRSKRELLTRGLISEATYDDIKGQIIAHREGTAATKKKKPSDDLRVPQ